MEKIKIEKNTVQETLIIPLYGRKMCSEKFSALYTDIYAKKLCDRLDYDFSELEKKNGAVALANIFAGRQPYFLPKMASKSVTAPIPFYKRSSFIDIPFGMPYFKLFYF